MNNDIELTPMMKQFLDLKAKHPDAVMLFRCGDFYETYSTDAIIAAEILGITLTKRANGKGIQAGKCRPGACQASQACTGADRKV